MNDTFDPQTLADDLCDVHRIYANLFAGLDHAAWDQPVRGGAKEWTLHETVAHLCALNGAGLRSIQHTLRGETYTFDGLDDRYQFTEYITDDAKQYLTDRYGYREFQQKPAAKAEIPKS